jgi:tRNA threonylcarbamoyl adenosine modification protein YjeE
MVLLEGDLGSGKTTLARALVRVLMGDPALDVPSPTFALVQPYKTPGGPLLHVDLYRIAAAAEVDELGLFDEPDAIALVEWPDRDPRLQARSDMRVVFRMPKGGSGRNIGIEAGPARFADTLARLHKRFPELA